MLDKLAEQVAGIFLAYGLIGAVAGILLYAVVKLYNRNQQLHDALEKIGQDAVTGQSGHTAAINKMSDTLNAMNTTLRQLYERTLQRAGK